MGSKFFNTNTASDVRTREFRLLKWRMLLPAPRRPMSWSTVWHCQRRAVPRVLCRYPSRPAVFLPPVTIEMERAAAPPSPPLPPRVRCATASRRCGGYADAGEALRLAAGETNPPRTASPVCPSPAPPPHLLHPVDSHGPARTGAAARRPEWSDVQTGGGSGRAGGASWKAGSRVGRQTAKRRVGRGIVALAAPPTRSHPAASTATARGAPPTHAPAAAAAAPTPGGARNDCRHSHRHQ